jgi:tetratricopeptide (TPR) repeat protein
MKKLALVLAVLAAAIAAVAFQSGGAAAEEPVSARLDRFRNLGKAFYENPTTQLQAVDEFKKALDLAPDSAVERLNYGLALLRAGKTDEGVAELLKTQQQDPKLPHTWFNLGIVYKKNSEYEKAIPQLEQMIKLVPTEAVSHYNLGVLYKLSNRPAEALKMFETSARLDPNLAGPHFQLFNAYRQAGRKEDAAREEQIFQELKKRKAGAAIPEDLEWSWYAEVYELLDPRKAAGDAPAAQVAFKAQALPGAADAATSGVAVADVDGDGKPDAIVWSSAGVLVYRGGTQPVEAGLKQLKGVVAISPADVDNDGLADLAVLTASGATLYLNRKGSFEAAPWALPQAKFQAAVWLDYDHDYDLDLFLLGAKCALYRNNGKAGFSDESAAFPFVAGDAIAGVTFDLMADTENTELVVSYAGRPGVLYRDNLGGKYAAEDLAALPAGATTLVARDMNADGATDIAAAGPAGVAVLLNREGKLGAATAAGTAPGRALALGDFENRGLADLATSAGLLRNRGLAKFQPAATEGFTEAAALAAADFDADGLTDLLAVFPSGSVALLRNETKTANNWLRAALTGVKNMRLAYGAEVEVKSGSYYQKQTYAGLPLQFGLRGAAAIDTVRITWANGLVQNELKQPLRREVAFKEAPRLSGSCPMIFTWNGQRFEFLTDVLGVAPLGASAGDGQFFALDHDEYVQVPPGALVERDGRYDIRVTEELREVSYLDQVRLIAIDHPADVEIFTNDKFKSPPFPEFRLFGVSRRVYPRAARDERGRDVLRRLTARDRSYVDTFERDYSGTAATHHLDLDFGAAAPANRAILVLNGWVDWADGSTFRAISQERPGGLTMPYVQVKDAAGNWKTVIEDMGLPAGKPKTIVVDLTGKFLSASREVRIVTGLCLYWDEIFLSEDTGSPAHRAAPLTPLSSELNFRGFSRPVIHPLRKQPEAFLYQHVVPASSWNPTPGLYTRYGAVDGLLDSIDDRMVIMGSGDELRLSFDARRLPPLRSGWQRDFLIFFDGWAKDSDANTAFARSVEPLPFHGMSGYPYPAGERYPQDALHTEYLKQYQTRPALVLVRPLRNNPNRSTE